LIDGWVDGWMDGWMGWDGMGWDVIDSNYYKFVVILGSNGALRYYMF
jgi:hypothetical protein